MPDWAGNDVPITDVSPITSNELQRLAMTGSLWTALHAITGVPVAFLANAIVARYLGVTDYGSLALLTVTFGIATQIANAGFSDSLVRNGAESEARGDTATTDRLLRASLGFHLLVELPLLWLVALVIAHDESWVVLSALLLSSLMSSAFGGAALYITLANRGAAGAKLAMVSNLVVQSAIATTAVLTGDPIAVIAARFLFAAAMVPLAVLAVPRERRRVIFTLRLPRHMPPGFWRFGAQSFLVGMMGLLVFSRSEILLLGLLADPAAVGLFALAFGLSTQITAPVDAMLNPLAPAVTGVVASRPDLVGKAFLRASRFSALLCALITGALLPVVYFAIPVIYGEEFREAGLLLLPLATISCIQSMGQTSTAFAFARQQGSRLLRANAVALVVNVAAGVPLIVLIGVWGAVLANMVGQLTSVVLLTHGELSLQHLRWRDYLATTRIWPISVATGIAALVMSSELVAPRWGDVAAGAASGVVGLALVILGGKWTRSGLDGADRDAMLDACPRRTRAALGVLTGLFVRPARATEPADGQVR